MTLSPVNKEEIDVEMVGVNVGGQNAVGDEELTGLNSGTSSAHKYQPHMAAASFATNLVILAIIIAFGVVIVSITSATYDKVKNPDTSTLVSTAMNPALGLSGFADMGWDDIEATTFGTSINFWMYRGDPLINSWIDTYFVPGMFALYNIKVVIMAQGAPFAVTQMQTEKAAGNTDNGQVDLVWINGPNFKNAKSDGLLYGPWAYKVPSGANFDFEDDDIKFDFGEPTNGLEMPYNKAQMIFAFNPDCGTTAAPQTIDELFDWVVANPDKFAYPEPTDDFTGSAFIRLALYNSILQTTPYAEMLGDYSDTVFAARAPQVFAKLRSIESSLHGHDGEVHYPHDMGEMDAYFASGETCLTFSYESKHVSAQIASGAWKNNTIGYVLTSGTLANVNFLAVGKNAANKLGGVVGANYMAKAATQYSRANPVGKWRATQTYNPAADAFVESGAGWNVAFDFLQASADPQDPTEEMLFEYSLPEVNAQYTQNMNANWLACVENYNATTTVNPLCG